MPKQMTREELWDLQYRKRPYLRHATEEQLHVRIFDIINNLRTLTIENKIGLLSPKIGGEYWMSRFSHVLEELGLRGRGVLPMSDFAHELKGVSSTIPDVESQICQHSETPYALKFSKREYNEQALTGHIRISSASSYDDNAKLRAVRDRELVRTTYHIPHGVELVTRENQQAKPVKATERNTRSSTDYFMYCVSMRYSRRLFHDFRADSCLLIYDVDEFMNRLIEAVKRKFSDFDVSGHTVKYFDPFDCAEIPNVFFMKPFSYAYQREFRLIWIPRSPVERLEPFFIEMGSLENCAELIG